MNYCWVRAGERKRVPYEAPQGRRYNTLEEAVDAAFVRVERKVLGQCQHHPRLAA